MQVDHGFPWPRPFLAPQAGFCLKTRFALLGDFRCSVPPA
jgi:hypothetical protein